MSKKYKVKARVESYQVFVVKNKGELSKEEIKEKANQLVRGSINSPWLEKKSYRVLNEEL